MFTYIYSIYAINFSIVSIVGFYYFYRKITNEKFIDFPFIASLSLCIPLYLFGPFIFPFYISTNFWKKVLETFIATVKNSQ